VLADEAVDRDLLVSAQTGSGKTVAYGLAMAKNLLGRVERFERAAAPLALIVAPTRELALQGPTRTRMALSIADGRVVSCVGGMDPRHEQRSLPRVLTSWSGRPADCAITCGAAISISRKLMAVVLDEADEMLNLGFREDMEFILKTTPDTRRTLLFSGDFSAWHRLRLQSSISNRPFGSRLRAMKVVTPISSTAPSDSPRAMSSTLSSTYCGFFESPSALVFCNTRDAVRHLQTALLERGFSVVALSGELTQSERTQALQALRDGRSRVCVATDVAARASTCRDLTSSFMRICQMMRRSCSIAQAAPAVRARKGVSILLVPPARKRRAELLLNLSGIAAIWGTAPQADEIRKARS